MDQEMNLWRQSVDQRLDLIISILQQEGTDIMSTIQEAKAQLDAAIAAQAASNAAAFQTLDDACASLTSETQKVYDDVTALLQEVKNGAQVDVTAELAAIAQNATNANTAAQVIGNAVNAATAQETSADQAVNPPDSSDMPAPQSKPTPQGPQS